MVNVFHASEKFDSNLDLDAGMHKINAHPYPPKTHGHGWAWAWVWAPNVRLCKVVKRQPICKGKQIEHMLNVILILDDDCGIWNSPP